MTNKRKGTKGSAKRSQIHLIYDARAPGIESAYIEAPFDIGKKTLEAEGYHIVSLQEMAQLRMNEGVNAFVSRTGNWTREGVLYVPNRGIYLVRNSPIMNWAEGATYCHMTGRDFYLTEAEVEKALAESVELNDEGIPTNRFRENEVTQFAFREDAEEYGLFLKETGIEEALFLLRDRREIQYKPFATPIFLHRIYPFDIFEIDGDYGNFDLCDGVRGVRAADYAQNHVRTSPHSTHTFHQRNL